MVLFVIMAFVLLIMYGTSSTKSALLTTFISFMLLIGFIFWVAKTTCGPNKQDVAVMKPVAQSIADYIVAHGIPKSLADIPSLSNGLSGCERDEEYRDYSNNKSTKDEAIVLNIEEKCNYSNNIKIDFGATFDLENNIWGGRIEQTSLNETVLIYSFRSDDNNLFKFSDMDIGSRKDDGICNPMRQ